MKLTLYADDPFLIALPAIFILLSVSLMVRVPKMRHARFLKD